MAISRQGLCLVGGALLAAGVGVWARTAGLSSPAAWASALTLLCASYWILEPIPVEATSLIPFAIFPFAGVMDEASVARAYGNPILLLLLAGFMLSAALERSGAHKRLAVLLLRIIGSGSRKRLILAFMIATALISM